MSQAKAARLRSRIQIDPDALPAAPAPPLATAPTPAPEPTPPARKQQPTERSAEYVSALDDPAILEGRNGYRSFYVDDAVFARFRAAIYWLSRREDALDQVPQNMSAAIEDFMRQTTDELETRFNDGKVFRATPDQLKSSRRRKTQP